MSDLTDSFHSLKQQLPDGFSAATGLILGSGLGKLLASFDITKSIDYEQIEGFPKSTAPSHAGRLHIANHQSKPLIIFEGRFHLYEGWSAQQAAMPVRLCHLLGVKNIIITNAVGALNPDFTPGDVLLINDHINFTGHSPLLGENDDSVGSRFPDMSQAYNRNLLAIAQQSFSQHSVPWHQGIYAGVFGPELETSAERRYLRLAGADAVGMSLVMETIAANHCGIKVLAIAAITNNATGGEDQQPDSIEEVLKNAAISADKIVKVLPDIVSQL